MTLNISVVSPFGIWMSSDFRLTDPVTERPRLYDSPKIVRVTYLNPMWAGMISYAGLGSLWNLETSEWVGQKLQGKEALDFAGLLTLLRSEGDAWLDQLPLNARAHTFNVAGFVEGEARFALVSNVDHLDGFSEHVPNRQLRIERVSIDYDARVFVEFKESSQHRLVGASIGDHRGPRRESSTRASCAVGC